jgi:Ca2+-binding EF-hand superfamily protein
LKLAEAEQEVQALRDAFDLFDMDGSGDIDRSEFKNLMKVGLNHSTLCYR